jgi:Putative inner membrane protein (DUF1819)
MEITARIIKGGALLDDSRRFVETWNLGSSADENLRDFRLENLLHKRSRSRAEDTVAILRQRFVNPGEEVIPALKALLPYARSFTEACYFEAARSDDLLAHVAGDVLYERRGRTGTAINVDQVERDLLDGPAGTTMSEWGQSTRARVLQGILSALRDFGILEGRARKYLARPHLSAKGIAYVLGRLRDLEDSSHDIVTSRAWRWWFYDERDIRAALLGADRDGVIRFAQAGSAVRIDWHVNDPEGAVRAAS